MSKFDLDLARSIRRELTAASPKGEFDVTVAKVLYVQRLSAFDLADLKMASADAAYAALDRQQPALTGQQSLPGIPPDEEEYIPIAPNKRVCAFTADAQQVLLWQRYAEAGANKQFDRVRRIKERTDPILFDYMLPRQMRWGPAAQQYTKDHLGNPAPDPDPDDASGDDPDGTD